MNHENIFTWKIAGQAGQGQQIAGLILAKTLSQSGYYCFSYSEYSSRLRGGLATNQVSISNKPIRAAYKKINLLFALSQPALNSSLNSGSLAKRALVFYDNTKVIPPKAGPEHEKNKTKYLPLSLDKFINQGLEPAHYNIFVLGISLALFKGNFKSLEQTISKVLSQKDKKIIEQNKKAAQLGWQYVQKHNFLKKEKLVSLSIRPTAPKNNKNLVITANEAVALGAALSDCRLYTAYPMTPASSILHTLARWTPKIKMKVLHPEDEIAAIHLAVGASWAGARAMTGTSGGGFALMNEGFALAGMSETPLVVVDAQRPGPSTGMATWTEQGDLEYVAKAGYGEFPRIILAPSDPTEAFYLTSLAFNLADKYQTPVVMLMDKYVSSSYQTVSELKPGKLTIDHGKLLSQADLNKTNEYYRYRLGGDGVSPRSVPGQKNGLFLANGNEHDEYGLTIDGFSQEMRKKQMRKRQVKIEYILKDLPKPKCYGPDKAKLTLVGWGSVKGPVLEALKALKRVNYCHLPAPWPLDKKLMKKLFRNKRVAVIENNYSGQLASLIQESLGQEFKNRLNKYNGRQFWPEEIVKMAKEKL